MRRLWLIFALASGCTRPLAGGSCSDHKDATSCSADDACSAIGCPTCGGGTSFAGCYDQGSPQPGFNCPEYECPAPLCHDKTQSECAAATGFGCRLGGCCGVFSGCLDASDPPTLCTLACTSCHGLSETQCNARFDCRADHCPSCDPAHPGFACANVGDPLPQCPAPPCPPPISCDQVTDESSCGGRSDCHAIYEPAACGCAFCCCTPFSHCASGGKTNCLGPALCNSAPPACANTACNPAFVVSYTNGCYEGCVHQSECQ